MKLGSYFSWLIITTLIALASLVAILIYLSPDSADYSIFILFYLSLLIASTGIFTIIGWIIRWVSQRKSLKLSRSRALRQLEISFRQGTLLSCILISVLILQDKRILTWWHMITIVLIVGLAEWWLSRR
jgi:hypothetical protein